MTHTVWGEFINNGNSTDFWSLSCPACLTICGNEKVDGLVMQWSLYWNFYSNQLTVKTETQIIVDQQIHYLQHATIPL